MLKSQHHWPAASTQLLNLIESHLNPSKIVSAYDQSGRASLRNGLIFSLPQMVDRADKSGIISRGLWNSLSSILGAGSFDHTNTDTCWSAFHASDSTYASDHVKKISTLKTRRLSSLQALGEEPPSQTPSSAARSTALAAACKNSTRQSWINYAETNLGSLRSVPRRCHGMTPEPRSSCGWGGVPSPIGSLWTFQTSCVVPKVESIHPPAPLCC